MRRESLHWSLHLINFSILPLSGSEYEKNLLRKIVSYNPQGGIGRDNLPGHEIEDLNAFDIYNTSAQSIKAAERVNGSSAFSER